VMWKF